MQIKHAGVPELVDGRGLKFVAPFEIHRIFCITRPETKTKIDCPEADMGVPNDEAGVGASIEWVVQNDAPTKGQIPLRGQSWERIDRVEAWRERTAPYRLDYCRVPVAWSSPRKPPTCAASIYSPLPAINTSVLNSLRFRRRRPHRLAPRRP